MNWFHRRPYSWLLAALLLLLVLVPADHQERRGRFFTGVLYTLVYLAGFSVVLKYFRYRRVGWIIAIPAIVGAWIGFAQPDLPPVHVAIGFHVVSIVFLVLTTVIVLRAIFHLQAVTTDEVAGALCGYLLIGVAFGHAYSAIEQLLPGSFVGDAEIMAGLGDRGRQHMLLTYYSFVTLTTVGYGDITPARGLTRGLATVEAILGQFYIAVLVGDLIGKKVAQALSDQRSDSKGTDRGMN